MTQTSASGASAATGDVAGQTAGHTRKNLPVLVLGALGVVYGDIGTSPIYAFRQAFADRGTPGELTTDVLGLLSLMLHAHARRDARRNGAGDYVPLSEQDPARWDAAMVDEAETLLHRANRCDGIPARYQLEAAVQSAHAMRRRTGVIDWPAIEHLYDALCELTGSPVAALNRAVALAETRGPAAGLAALDALASDARLAEYQPYWAARAELLMRSGAARRPSRPTRKRSV
jgi:RNA polymerase sigma-70 factor (ECF subfamily)